MNDQTNEEILSEIEELSGKITDPRIVTEEQMNRLFPIYGSEEAIKNHLQRDNDAINEKIDELTSRLSQQS